MTRPPNRRLGVEYAEELAAKLGARRTQGYRLGAPDLTGQWFVVEVATGLKVAQVAYHALRALRAATSEKDLPLYIYKHPDWGNWVVAMLLSDFLDFFDPSSSPKPPAKTEGGSNESR